MLTHATSSPSSSKRSKSKSHKRSSSTTSSSATSKALSIPIANNAGPRHEYSQIPLRTLGDVRAQVADEVAYRVLRKAEVLDGVKISVLMVFSRSDDVSFLKQVADAVSDKARLQDHLFSVATTGPPVGDAKTNYVILSASSHDHLQRAVLLTSNKFLGRIESVFTDDSVWIAEVKDVGQSAYDEAALWDVVRKSARAPMEPFLAPPGSRGIDEILDEARAKLQRVTPRNAYQELQEPEVGAPTFLVDIRPAAQREEEGSIPGSLIIERNVLEWRFDPRSSSKLSFVDSYDLRIIIFCQEGYTSSLAADSLQKIGMLNATDIIGGYKAWKEAGLPVEIPPILVPPPRLSDASWSLV